MSTTPAYQPVPVEAAKAIAAQFAKSQIVIIAVDPAFACTHYTTYGVSPQDKAQSAAIGDEICRILNDGKKLATFEDFRAVPAAESQAKIEAMQKRYDDDVAELNARLIQRREDYAAHSVQQAQELQTTRVRLEHAERRENHLREAMEQQRNYLEQEKCFCIVSNETGDREICGRCIALDMAEQALAQPAPLVVPILNIAPLIDAGLKVLETNNEGGDIAEAFHELDMAMREFNHKHPGI